MAVRQFTLAPSQDTPDLDTLLSEVLDGVSCSWMENPDGTVRLWVDGPDAEDVRLRLQEGGVAIAGEVDEEERDWVEESAALRRAVAVGRYLFDPHQGERASLPGPRRRLYLPAARAFGTASHESTRLAVRLLQSVPLRGLTVADAGCGAGTLGFVAMAEGAARVVAFDIDPDAAFATREHARDNAVSGVMALAGTTAALRSGFPWAEAVVANMLREELLPLLTDLGQILPPGGLLLTSGQLVEAETPFTSELEAAGFDVFLLLKENEWLATASRKRGPRP